MEIPFFFVMTYSYSTCYGVHADNLVKIVRNFESHGNHANHDIGFFFLENSELGGCNHTIIVGGESFLDKILVTTYSFFGK